MSMNRLTTMSRVWLQDLWGHARAWRRSLPPRQKATKRWRRALIAIGLLACPLAAEPAVPTTNTIRLIVGADFGVCGHPDNRGRLYAKLNGHEFDVHRASVVRDWTTPDGKTSFVSGQISHKLAWRPDDEIYYAIPFQDGKPQKPDIQIDHGGVGALVDFLPLEIISSLKIKIGDVEIGLTPEKLPEAVGEIGTYVEGRGWEGQAAALVAAITIAATMPDYCSQFYWTEWISEEGNLPSSCNNGFDGAIGFACAGSNCDNVKLACARVPGGLLLDEGTTRWSEHFSEEGAKSGQNLRLCNAIVPSGIVTGIHCTGRYCDNIALECTSPMSLRFEFQFPHFRVEKRPATLTGCGWSGWLSEEDGGVFNFSKGNFITGVECGGSYCDNKRFFVCSLVP
jgi:hypothetical protein